MIATLGAVVAVALTGERYSLRTADGGWPPGTIIETPCAMSDAPECRDLAKKDRARIVAKDLFLQGYTLEATDPAAALKLYREVMRTVPATDEYHVKAKAKAAELEKALPAQKKP